MPANNCPLDSRPTAPPHSRILCLSILCLRFCAVLSSCMTVVLLSIAPSQSQCTFCHDCFASSLSRYPQIVVAIALLYSACQLLKNLCEIAIKRHIFEEVCCDCITFIIDQLLAYLLVSSSSILFIVKGGSAMASDGCGKMAAVASVTSFCTFVFLAFSAGPSGYKLARRISCATGPFNIWDFAFFILDQVAAYLLLSSISLLISAAKSLVITSPCGHESVAAAVITITFCAFFFVAVCALHSGYRLGKGQRQIVPPPSVPPAPVPSVPPAPVPSVPPAPVPTPPEPRNPNADCCYGITCNYKISNKAPSFSANFSYKPNVNER